MSDGWSESAAWIAELGEAGDFGRSAVLDAPMLTRLRERGFRQALNIGCGEGRFCRRMQDLGVETVGIDPTDALLRQARARDPGGIYLPGRVEGTVMALPFANGAFDPVVSYLTLIDVPDIRAAIPEMARVLRPGGTLLIANRTSFGTAGACPDDGDAVTAVLAASYPVLMAASYEADTLTWALPLMVRANPALLASGRFHLAEVPDGIVGVGGWTPERPGTGEIEPGLGHVRHFAVHPAWIGRGVGRRVFAACRSQAQGGGVSVFECYASLNAEPFYRALGFREFGRREIPLGGGTVGFPAVLMRCRL